MSPAHCYVIAKRDIKHHSLVHVQPQSKLLNFLKVFADGRLLGGCDETLELLESGELQRLLQSSSKSALPEDLAEIVTQSASSSQVILFLIAS